MNENELEKRINELETQVKKNTTICNIVLTLWVISGIMGLGVLLIYLVSLNR